MPSDMSGMEAEELLRLADWHMRAFDTNPGSNSHLEAANCCETMVTILRTGAGGTAYKELIAILNWLGEAGGLDDFAMEADRFRRHLTPVNVPATADSYWERVLEIARNCAGIAS